MKLHIYLMLASLAFINGCTEKQAKVQQTTTAEGHSEDWNNRLSEEFNMESNYIDFSEIDITEKYIQSLDTRTNIQGMIIIESGTMHYPMIPGDQTLIDDRWRL